MESGTILNIMESYKPMVWTLMQVERFVLIVGYMMEPIGITMVKTVRHTDMESMKFQTQSIILTWIQEWLCLKFARMMV